MGEKTGAVGDKNPDEVGEKGGMEPGLQEEGSVWWVGERVAEGE